MFLLLQAKSEWPCKYGKKRKPSSNMVSSSIPTLLNLKSPNSNSIDDEFSLQECSWKCKVLLHIILYMTTREPIRLFNFIHALQHQLPWYTIILINISLICSFIALTLMSNKFEKLKLKENGIKWSMKRMLPPNGVDCNAWEIPQVSRRVCLPTYVWTLLLLKAFKHFFYLQCIWYVL